MKNAVYKMRKEMWDNIRYPMVWDKKQKKMVKKDTPISKKEALDYINKTFRLKPTIVDVTLI